MGILGFGKKDRVVDLGERYKRQQEHTTQIKTEAQESNNSSETEEYADASLNIEERRKKLAKRLGEMANKMENISTQIYHLQQRVDLLEKKLDVRRD